MLIVIPAALLAISFHEMAHGWSAYMLGDPTARNAGRLTINPLDHIDPIGFLCILVAGVGWAKPVPINPFYFKHRKRDIALTALAGPAANILLCFVGFFIAYGIAFFTENRILTAVAQFFMITASISAGLAVFNLIPVPPLDGSKIIYPLLPNRIVAKIMPYEGPIRFVLLAVVFLGALDGIIGAGQSLVVRTAMRVCNRIFMAISGAF